MNQYKEDIMQGEERLLTGKTDEALEIFNAVLEKDPDNVQALNNKGVAYNRLSRYEEAIQVFQSALERNGNNSNAVFNLISNCFSAGKWKEAEHTLVEYGHCLPQQDKDMIKRDLVKAESNESNMADSRDSKIVEFSVSFGPFQYNLKISLDLNQFSQKIIWGYLSNGKLYEPETSQFVEKVLKGGDCFVDIGAHIGYFSLLAAKIVGDHGSVLSFEPERKNYDQLKQHIAMNDLTNIKTFDIALSSEDKGGELFVNSDNDGGHALWNVSEHPLCKKSRYDQIKQRVTIATLDSILQTESVDRIKLIKIDTEGTEHNILLGSFNTIKRCKVPYIICEINRFGLKHMGTSEPRLREFMKELGYETYLIRQEEPKLLRLSPGDQVETDYVFNVVFIKPENLI